MPFRKWSEDEEEASAEAWDSYCRHPEHEPPTMIVLQPGTYDWTCPGCGAVRTVRVPARPMLRSSMTFNRNIAAGAIRSVGEVKRFRVGWVR